jgi:lipid-binding SYLF domain-containing protein
MRAHTIAFTLLTAVAVSSVASAAHDPILEARQTLAVFEKADPSMKHLLERSAGYAVFPSVTKAAVGVGGARGSGILFDRTGTPVAKLKVTQVSIGVQLGAEGYSEVIFFETPQVFTNFQAGNFELAAGLSAVALSRGAAQNAAFRNGVAVFTATNKGLMLEASVGGQKFKVEPLNK